MKSPDIKPNRFIRFEAGGFSGYGCVIEDKAYPINGDIFEEYEIVDNPLGLEKVRFLPPCIPQKIICVGLNYVEHVRESTLSEIPDEPVLFFKPPSALIGHLDTIILPDWVDQIDYEGELAVIIGRKLKNVSEESAQSGIFGYTCLNDVTARNIQRRDKQWTRGKGFDTFCPMGPYILKDIDASGIDIEVRLNQKVVQRSNTGLMIRKPAEIISYISRVMTLFPGDVIATGTPSGVGPLRDGDQIEIDIRKIGVLKNFAASK
jgi:2-keto-4-pentenoate hydratase/2-oxohepta-3-ene-1,7-dioic acid hydratase in catechol pathway